MERHIQSKIYELSNNSQVTHSVIEILFDKLDENELREFYRWLQIVESQKQLEINRAKNSIGKYF